MAVPLPDPGTPLIDWPYLVRGQLADLFREYDDPEAQAELLIQATRAAEDECGRRLAPFTGLVETQQAYGIDPDELSGGDGVPLDLAGSLGRSWGQALGSSALVRRVHLDHYAAKYPDMWSYSDVRVRVVRSYGDVQDITSQILMGPTKDTGLLWFRLGTWIPLESEFEITYSGGYTTCPGGLARAVKFLAASIVVNDLDPLRHNGRDPDALVEAARRMLVGYFKE